MNKERLSFLSLDELKNIAKRLDVDADIDDRDDLIDEIVEAFEEEHVERQVATNLAMYIKQKKFELFLGGSDYHIDEDVFEDPYSSQVQCDTQIHFLLRDPHWGFVYWKFSKSDYFNIKTQKMDLMLRVFQFKEYNEFNPNILTDQLDYFDIEIDSSDNKWYINLPYSGFNYAVQLILIEGDKKTILASSNTIYSPNIAVKEEIKANIDETIVKCGLYDPTIEEKVSEKSIHRILSNEESTFEDSAYEAEEKVK